ncbi:MAG: branched-chain alpha-keto acid dehydrogenase subunit E2 [Methylococcaceae bacterium]|nr:MAG: branched-chain alpha-keto acid dehydrogenase subunit E2 [Methylococcaceae bacterium]
MAEQIVRVPNVGDFKALEIIEVLVKPGDTLALDQSIITLESDKASMEIPSPLAGVVKSLQVKKGDKVSEGAEILTLELAAAGAAVETPSEIAPPAPTVAETAKPQEVRSEAPAPGAHCPPYPAPCPSPYAASPLSAQTANSCDVIPHASPAIRRFARELGADVAQISGSGPKGRILKEDVQAYIKARLQQAAAGPALPAMPSIDFSAFGPVETRALTRIQKLSASYLLRAWQTIPHVTHHDEADVTDLEAFRVSLKDESAKKGVKLTLLPFVAEAVVATLKAFPQFNASLDGDNLVLKSYYHIGMAVDTEEGLVVPVLRDADRMRTFEIAAAMADLSERARKRQLKRSEIEGGSFTLSSLGGVGGRYFTPIINAPEVAILGLCRTYQVPVYQPGTGQFSPRLMLPLSLSYDHRVIDGAVAARFMNHLKALLGDIRRLLL